MILAIQEKYEQIFDFEVLSGGMVVGDRIGPIKDAAPPNILEIYERIESFTGTKFGEEYLAKVAEGDSLRNSEIPAAALAVFKSHQPKQAIAFAHNLQEKLFVDALEIDDQQLYESLATEFGLNGPKFYEQMQLPEVMESARYEFALAKQLQVTGYPQLLVQTDETHFYLIAKGYTRFEELNARVEKVLVELKV